MTNENNQNDARTLWNYMLLHEPVRPADVLLVLGSIDDRVAAHAALLSRTYNYPLVVMTGGEAHGNDMLKTGWPERTEAEHFQKVYEHHGGCMQNVLMEMNAQHTGENATLTFAMLQAMGRKLPHAIQIVTKPYMERRARATFELQWPDKQATFFVTSPPILFDDYFTATQPFEKVVHILVGDYQRVREYPRRGLQAEQPVDDAAEQAFDRLVRAGFTGQLIK